MPDQSHHFTQRAQKVLLIAQETAERWQHRRIGSQHLLIGLIRVENSIPTQVSTQSTHSSRESLIFLERLAQEIGLSDTSNLDADHVLLVWMKQHQPVVNSVLVEMGADVDQFWRLLESKLNKPPDDSSAA